AASLTHTTNEIPRNRHAQQSFCLLPASSSLWLVNALHLLSFRHFQGFSLLLHPLTGTHTSIPPIPVRGSNSSEYRSKKSGAPVPARGIGSPHSGNHLRPMASSVSYSFETCSRWAKTAYLCAGIETTLNSLGRPEALET